MSIFESFGLSPIGVTDLHVLCIHGVVSVVARVGSTHGVLARAPPSLPPEAPLERGLNQVLVQVNIEGFVLGKGYEVVPPQHAQRFVTAARCVCTVSESAELWVDAAQGGRHAGVVYVRCTIQRYYKTKVLLSKVLFGQRYYKTKVLSRTKIRPILEKSQYLRYFN